jgi:hypothetical protein
MTRTLATISAIALIASLGMSAPADAGRKTKNIVTGIIIGAGAAALLGAAANSAQAAEDDPVYAYDDNYDPEQNAVAACLHRAYRELVDEGSEGTELRRVRRVRPIGSESFSVDLSLVSYNDGIPDPAEASCRVVQERVTRISIR